MGAHAQPHSALGSVAVTQGVRISARPRYLPDHSEPDAARFIFRYRIHIANESDGAVTLLRRHWIIVDGQGQRRDVEGEGVIGAQPRIEPGHTYEYESFCPLTTSWGTMEGSYAMARDDGSEFAAEVARFYLVADESPA